MKIDFETLRRAIAKALEVEPSTIELTTPLKGNELWDSFALLSVVALVTEHSGKQLKLDDVAGLDTVADLVRLLDPDPVTAHVQ